MTDKDIIRCKYQELKSRVDSVVHDCEIISTEKKLDALGAMINNEEARLRQALESYNYAEVANLNIIKSLGVGLDYVYSEYLEQEKTPKKDTKP